MDSQTLLKQLTPDWTSWLFIAIRLLFIAIVFEFLAWWAGRKLAGLASPFLNLDRERDSKWRAARRATLQTTPKIAARGLLYAIALVMVFRAFSLPVLEVSIAVAALACFLGAALLPLLRDYAAGYVMLSEDTLAPGDRVEIDGRVGVVERWTLRATWLRDEAGRMHVLSNRQIGVVSVISRALGEAKPAARDGIAFDPMAKPRK